MAKRIPVVPVYSGPKCSNCKYMVEDNHAGEKATFCYRYPPQIITDSEGVPWSIRTEIDSEDRACGEFKAMN